MMAVRPNGVGTTRRRRCTRWRSLTAAKCQHALANLNGEFATIQTTEQLIAAVGDFG